MNVPVFIGKPYNKYKNIKTEVNGIKFASKKEAKRYSELRLMWLGNRISDLQTQVRFELIPAMVINGKKECKISYIADFVYKDKGVQIVEDVKGIKTDVFKIKYRLMKQVHDIDVVLI